MPGMASKAAVWPRPTVGAELEEEWARLRAAQRYPGDSSGSLKEILRQLAAQVSVICGARR
jgi:hypothetical protein